MRGHRQTNLLSLWAVGNEPGSLLESSFDVRHHERKVLVKVETLVDLVVVVEEFFFFELFRVRLFFSIFYGNCLD